MRKVLCIFGLLVCSGLAALLVYKAAWAACTVMCAWIEAVESSPITAEPNGEFEFHIQVYSGTNDDCSGNTKKWEAYPLPVYTVNIDDLTIGPPDYEWVSGDGEAWNFKVSGDLHNADEQGSCRIQVTTYPLQWSPAPDVSKSIPMTINPG